MRRTMSIQINGRTYKGKQLLGALIEVPDLINVRNPDDIGLIIVEVLDEKRVIGKCAKGGRYEVTKDRICKFYPLNKRTGEHDGL